MFSRWSMAAGSGVLAMVCAVSAAAKADHPQGEVVGKVQNVLPQQHQLTVRDDDNRDWTFTLDDTTKVQFHNRSGKLDNLKIGERVDVVYRLSGYVPQTIQTLPKDKFLR